MAAYLSVLQIGDRILGMNLAHGGHLTHGSPVNFSGKWFDVQAYGVREEDGRIDYDALERQAAEVRPKMIVAGASAYPRIIDFERMGAIAHSVDALLFVDMAHIAGLVAAGLHPSPFPHADLVTTTTHKTLRGPRGGMVFSRADLASRSTRRSSRASRAARSCTSSPPRRSPSSWRPRKNSDLTCAGRLKTPRFLPRHWPTRAREWSRAARTTT